MNSSKRYDCNNNLYFHSDRKFAAPLSLEMEATVMRSCFEDMNSAYNGKI